MASERYADDRIHCTACPAQPGFFHEVMAWQINRVSPDGTHIESKECEVSHYECPTCEGIARWGWQLNEGRR